METRQAPTIVLCPSAKLKPGTLAVDRETSTPVMMNTDVLLLYLIPFPPASTAKKEQGQIVSDHDDGECRGNAGGCGVSPGASAGGCGAPHRARAGGVRRGRVYGHAPR